MLARPLILGSAVSRSSLGFTSRQLSATVAWHAISIVLVGLAGGVPAGIVGGRLLWRKFADQLNVEVEPQSSLLLAATVVTLTLVIANVVAVLPGRSARKVRAGLMLRSAYAERSGQAELMAATPATTSTLAAVSCQRGSLPVTGNVGTRADTVGATTSDVTLRSGPPDEMSGVGVEAVGGVGVAGMVGAGVGTGASERTIAAANRARLSSLRRSMLSPDGLPTNSDAASDASRSMLYG